MIIDCIPFNRELDLLEIRLNVLWDVVDLFHIVELDHTHSGRPKPFVLEENWDRFVQYDQKIEYRKWWYNHVPSPWELENEHRELTIPDTDSGDLIVVSDLDEIPNPEQLAQGLQGRYIQNMYYFYLNAYAYPWRSGTFVLQNLQYTDVQEIRSAGHANRDLLPVVEDGGWHFSSVGTEDDVRAKLKSFAHTEMSSDEFIEKSLENRRNGKDIHGDSLKIVEIDETYPKYLQENQDKYRHLIYDTVRSV